MQCITVTVTGAAWREVCLTSSGGDVRRWHSVRRTHIPKIAGRIPEAMMVEPRSHPWETLFSSAISFGFLDGKPEALPGKNFIQRGFWDLEGVVPVIAVVFYAFEAFTIGKDSCGGSTREIP